MRYKLEGLDCPNCAVKIERELRTIKGLDSVRINFATSSVELPPERLHEAKNTIRRVEPAVSLTEFQPKQTSNRKNSQFIREYLLLTVAALLFIIGLIFHEDLHRTPYSWAEYSILLPAYLLVGGKVLRQAIRNLIQGRWLDENFLMSIATIGAFAIHQVPEAVGVMLFYRIGQRLEESAVERSRGSIDALLRIQAETANLRVDGEVIPTDPRHIKVAQIIMVKPGERVPLDGLVIEGESFLDTSALTGEPTPRKAGSGDLVLAGMVNGQGLLVVEVTKVYADSAVSRILKLVEEANERKAPAEHFISVFARYYTPLVVGAAFLVAVLPPLFIPGATFAAWLYRALVLLVISCPCALMISIPLSYFGGIGGASRRGILVKGANYLDALADIKTIVFDKTGTLTKGVFRVTQIIAQNGFSEHEILEVAAAVEVFSNHPIARSIREAWDAGSNGKPIMIENVREYQELPGCGVSAIIKERRIKAGNEKLLKNGGMPLIENFSADTMVYLIIDDQYAGMIVISDELKPDAAESIVYLKKLGIQETVMLSGDTEIAAQKVAGALHLDTCHAGLLPEDKVNRLRDMKAALANTKGKVAFVGDGINDAPVLATADIGIAMGALGSDAAIEAADLVIMNDALPKIAEAVQLARRVRWIVRQNIFLALAVKLFFVTLGTIGLASIWEAVFADVGVTLLAVLNASRSLNGYKKLT